MPNRALIFANGNLPDPKAARPLIRPGDLIIAADGGTRHALALGLVPSAIIGDLDSLTSDVRRITEQASVQLLEYPRDKDETDLELALDYALENSIHEIIILGALGGRLDQTLANLALLSSPELVGLNARLDDGVEEAFFVRSSSEIRGQIGETVSLVPWGAPVEGVITAGLKWPLRGETLLPHQTRGISNEMLGERANVAVQSGLLLVIHRRILLTDN
jgi:thiamine pyrophosphokinase